MAVDVRAALQLRLEGDATLLALLGGVAGGDTRVYKFYEGEADIDPTLPGYLTIANLSRRKSGAVVSPLYSIVVWTRGATLAEAIGQRLIDLLDQQVFLTPTGRKLYALLRADSESYQQYPKFSGRNLQFELTWLAN